VSPDSHCNSKTHHTRPRISIRISFFDQSKPTIREKESPMLSKLGVDMYTSNV